MKNESRLFAVSGVKNSGKTTLIEKLLPLLAERGVKTAVIKHDGHSFTPDTPGTDSFRFFAAGACGTAIFDGEKFSVTHRAKTTERELAALFPDADLILLEGFKESKYPKIELIRKENSSKPICTDETCLAYVSDQKLETDKPVFAQDDAAAVADFLCAYLKGGNDA